MTPSAVISIDFEFFEHIPAYRSASGQASSEGIGMEAIDFILDRLEEHDAATTFFTVSDIADKYPETLQEIARHHEIGSHTRSHPFLSALDPAERLDQLKSSKEKLEAVSGSKVRGFRAPSFDVPCDLFDLLDQTGYAYDSSVVPSRNIPGWYGGEFTQQRPATADCFRAGAPESIAEIPVAVMPKLRLPLSGTWLRFFGVRYARLGMRLLARRGIVPVLYLHPWEFVGLPKVTGVPKRVYFRTGEWMRTAFKEMLQWPYDYKTMLDLTTSLDGSN